MNCVKYQNSVLLMNDSSIQGQSFNYGLEIKDNLEFWNNEPNLVNDTANRCELMDSYRIYLSNSPISSQLTNRAEISNFEPFDFEISSPIASETYSVPQEAFHDDEGAFEVTENKIPGRDFVTSDRHYHVKDNMKFGKVTCESTWLTSKCHGVTCHDRQDMENGLLIDQMYQPNLIGSCPHIEFDIENRFYSKCRETARNSESKNQFMKLTVPEYREEIDVDEDSDNNSANMRSTNHYFNYFNRTLASRNSRIGLVTCDKMFSDKLAINVSKINRPGRMVETFNDLICSDFAPEIATTTFHSPDDQARFSIRPDKTSWDKSEHGEDVVRNDSELSASTANFLVMEDPYWDLKDNIKSLWSDGKQTTKQMDYSGGLFKIDQRSVSKIAKETVSFISEENASKCKLCTRTLDEEGKTNSVVFKVAIPTCSDYELIQCTSHLMYSIPYQRVPDTYLMPEFWGRGTNYNRLKNRIERRKAGILRKLDNRLGVKKSACRQYLKKHLRLCNRGTNLSASSLSNDSISLSDCEHLMQISTGKMTLSSRKIMPKLVNIHSVLRNFDAPTRHDCPSVDSQARFKRKIAKHYRANVTWLRRDQLLNMQRLTPKVRNTNPVITLQSKHHPSVALMITKKLALGAVENKYKQIISCQRSSWPASAHLDKSVNRPIVSQGSQLTNDSSAWNFQGNLQQENCNNSINLSSDDHNPRYDDCTKDVCSEFTNKKTDKTKITKFGIDYTDNPLCINWDEHVTDRSKLPKISRKEEFAESLICVSSVSKVIGGNAESISFKNQYQLDSYISREHINKDSNRSQADPFPRTVQKINASNLVYQSYPSRTLPKNNRILRQHSSMRQHAVPMLLDINYPTNRSKTANSGIEELNSGDIYRSEGQNETSSKYLITKENITPEKNVPCFCNEYQCPSNVSGIKRVVGCNASARVPQHLNMPDCSQHPFPTNTEEKRHGTEKPRSLSSTNEPTTTENVCPDWSTRPSWTLASSYSFGKGPTFRCRSSSACDFTSENSCAFVNVAGTFLESEKVFNKSEANWSLGNSHNIAWINETSHDREGGIASRKITFRRRNQDRRSSISISPRKQCCWILHQFPRDVTSSIKENNDKLRNNNTVKSCVNQGIHLVPEVPPKIVNTLITQFLLISNIRVSGVSCNNKKCNNICPNQDRKSYSVSTLTRKNTFSILEPSTCVNLPIPFRPSRDEHSVDTSGSLLQYSYQLSDVRVKRIRNTGKQFCLKSRQRQAGNVSTQESRRKVISDSGSSNASQRLSITTATSKSRHKCRVTQWRNYLQDRSWNLLFLLLTLLSMTSAGKACPTACNCKWKGGKMTVECVNKGLKNLPEYLDHETQVLDFAGNSLGIIAREKFKVLGLTNLQRIYVSRCKLEQLDDAAFRGLSNLVELDLSNNKLTMVPVAALEHAPALMRLQLSHNPISKIMDGSFSKLKSLITLEMTGCALQVMEPRAFQGLDKLEWLKLDDNQLKSVPETMLLPKMLHGVDLHNNPWHCDCKLQHLRSWLVKYNVPSSIEPKCSSPMRLETRIIKHVIPEDFACAPEVRPTSLFLDVLEGKNVSFACHVVAEPSADIDWKFNGHPLQNSSFIYDDTSSFYIYEDREVKEETVSHLKIEMVTEAHSGVFQCAAENTAGKMISNFTLRVSVPPTEPVPKDFIEDNFKYVGMALVGLIVLVISLCCILICKCCRRKSKSRSAKKTRSNGNNISRDKERQAGPISSMPKYIQMGTPTPKSNGISNAAAPISVIEASPYRSSPAGTPHPNPDLISDSSVEERTKPKKKVSILGVEEVDPNGIVTTRKLDDIVEEYEDSFVCQYDQSMQKNKDYESAQDLLNPPYSNISSCRIIANANPYPLMDIPSDDLQRQNLSSQNNFRYDVGDYHGDSYGLPKDDTWLEMSGNRVSSYCNMKNNHTAPAYATMRRNNSKHNLINTNSLVGQQKYPEEYQMQMTGSPYQTPDGRYLQSYGGLIVEKYQSNGTSPTTASTSLTGCDCCPDQKSCELTEVGGRMSGDGCSFDNLLGSCSGGVSGHCCYPETSGGRLFDNSLPENYTALPTPDLQDPALFGSGPLPPEGWRDGDCLNGDCVSSDCVKDNNQTPWDNMPLSPGTRVLYSPEDGFTNVVHCNSDSDMSRQSIQQQQQKSGETLPPATQV